MSESFYTMQANLVIGHKLICSARKVTPVVHTSDYWHSKCDVHFYPIEGLLFQPTSPLKIGLGFTHSHQCDLSCIVGL